MRITSSYAIGAAAVVVAKLAAGLAGLISLWLLAQILSKEALGGYAFGMALVGVVGMLATLGLDRTLLLRIAGRAPRSVVLRGRALAVRASAVALAGGALLAAAVAAGSDEIARLGASGADEWLPVLSLAIPAIAVSTMIAVWLQANHRQAAAAAGPPISDVTRCALLGLVFAAGLGPPAVAWSAVAAAAAPALILGLAALPQSSPAPGRLGMADALAGAQFLTLRLANQGTRQIDILLLGLLSTGAATADYAVAARLATVADYGSNVFKPTFTSRLRRHIASGEMAAATREFETVRAASLGAALAAAAVFAAVGGPLLALFGDFEGARPPLLLLAAAYVVNAGFGMHQTWLSMHGEIAWSSLMRIVALGALAASLFVLTPVYGAIGAGAAVLANTLLVNLLGAALAWRITRLKAPDGAALVLAGAPVAALVAEAFGWLGPVETLACLLAALSAVAWRLRSLIAGNVREAARRLRMLLR